MSEATEAALDEWARDFASFLIDRRPDEDTEDLIALAWREGWRKACETFAVPDESRPS